MNHLIDELLRYAEEDIYPYHMPGHKRRSCGRLSGELCRTDITEIDGFDNLHQPEGILLALQRGASRLYGAEESFYLVNGSTCGILSAVSTALPAGGHILIARNCHKSAYHGVYLRNLKVSYLYPPCLAEYDIFDAIKPQQIEEALEAEPDIQAVLIVSPTYEGRIADIREIARIVHERKIPLIVDEAHGAHLGLADALPPNSCQLGADLVIHSVHKTLPALTQSALLHVNGTLVERELLKRFLRIYQSSSPSYLLMAGIDNALEYVERSGQEAFKEFRRYFEEMMRILNGCRQLRVLSGETGVQDLGKLLISVKGTAFTGKQLYDILLKEYRLQLEMASETFVLAMFTVNDGQEAYERMTRALLEIDARLEEGTCGNFPKKEGTEEGISFQEREEAETPVSIPLAKAWDMETEIVPLEESVGKYAGEFLNLYPPGVPLLVPGEPITEVLCKNILRYVKEGLSVQGIQVSEGEQALEERISLKILRQLGRMNGIEKEKDSWEKSYI